MSSSHKTALVIGAGLRVGVAVAQSFAQDGYHVAVVSRNGTDNKTSEGYLSLKIDLANRDSITSLFSSVVAELGSFPNVVVYNAATLTSPPEKSLTNDLIVNTVSPSVAAQEAVKGWAGLSKDTKKSFIYTDSIQNVAVLPVPLMLTLGVGKSASAYWIGATAALYSGYGYRFFYADERHADSRIKGMDLDGAAHGELFTSLAKQDPIVSWHATFVKGRGYVKI